MSDAFYFFLSYQQDLEALYSKQNALMERIAELKKREELGRSRSSEVASAQASLSRLEADMESVKSDQEIAHQLLEFLTGTTIQSLDDSLNSVAGGLKKEDYLSKVDQRPDVIAAKEAWNIAKKNITVARSGFFPSASVDGNYYTERVGNAGDVKWDVGLKVSVPIFQGGENAGKVMEAHSQEREQELTFNETRRKALLEIENDYTKWQASLRRIEALQKAVEDSEKSYELQKTDYIHNLVNNLEVLQALEDFEQARRDLVAVENESKRFYSNLLVAVGEISQ